MAITFWLVWGYTDSPCQGATCRLCAENISHSRPMPRSTLASAQGHGTRTTFTFSSLLLLWQLSTTYSPHTVSNDSTVKWQLCIHVHTHKHSHSLSLSLFFQSLSLFLTDTQIQDRHRVTHWDAQKWWWWWGVTIETWTHWSSQEGVSLDQSPCTTVTPGGGSKFPNNKDNSSPKLSHISLLIKDN